MHLTPLTLDHCLPWAELLSISFGRTTDETAQVLTWLYGVYGVMAWGAWEGERLVAQYACLRRRLLIDDRTVEAGMSLNMSVHPDYRGRGLIKQVAQPVYESLRVDGALFGVGFSNADGVRVDRHSKGYGYQVVGRMVSTVAYLTPQRAAPLDLSDTLPAGEWALRDERVGIRFETTAQLLRHRYARHPFRRYRYGLWREGGELVGLVIYRPLRYRGGAALLGAYGADLPDLLARWSRAVRAEGVRVVHLLTTPSARLRRALAAISAAAALPYTRTPYYLTVKPLTESAPPALLDFAAWDCMGGEIL